MRSTLKRCIDCTHEFLSKTAERCPSCYKKHYAQRSTEVLRRLQYQLKVVEAKRTLLLAQIATLEAEDTPSLS